MIDDVLGRIILAVVSGIITAAELGPPIEAGAVPCLIGISVLGVAAGLTVMAIIGKQVGGWGVLEKGLDPLTVGVGIIPRGEVGLIFAGIGKSLKVIDDATFSAVVITVIVTTLITPPVLKLTLARAENLRKS